MALDKFVGVILSAYTCIYLMYFNVIQYIRVRSNLYIYQCEGSNWCNKKVKVGFEVLRAVLMKSSIFWDVRTTRHYIPEDITLQVKAVHECSKTLHLANVFYC
jgi:hypothetical protein